MKLSCRTIVIALALLSVFAARHLDASDKPNILLIMADDIGVEGLGCYGGLSYQTPALDRLAREGIRFTHAYAQPLCANTRLQLIIAKLSRRRKTAP